MESAAEHGASFAITGHSCQKLITQERELFYQAVVQVWGHVCHFCGASGKSQDRFADSSLNRGNETQSRGSPNSKSLRLSKQHLKSPKNDRSLKGMLCFLHRTLLFRLNCYLCCPIGPYLIIACLRLHHPVSVLLRHGMKRPRVPSKYPCEISSPGKGWRLGPRELLKAFRPAVRDEC